MNLKEQQKQAKAFIERWENRGNERQDTQSFWLDLLQSVYGIENPSEYIKFEDTVMMDHTSFMDGYIDTTKVLIEQKGANKDLSKAIKQSDGSFLTPFQQAKRYSANLPYSKQPRWIITCNFKEFYVYDMEKPHGEPTVIRLEDLEKEAYRLEFIVGTSNEHLEREMAISMEAGEIVREIYSGLLQQYKNPENPESLHAMNQLIVRLVFCFYAEDAGMFGKKTMFHDYLARFSSRDFRRGLLDLFNVLNTPIDERDPYLDDELSAFPYVNGGMFAENNLEVPQFTDELRESILEHASSSFDWSEISPTIFGAVFESTLNPETRRSGGMHYTSIENIHKVIDPLFLDGLKEELNEISKKLGSSQEKIENFKKILEKIASQEEKQKKLLDELKKLEDKSNRANLIRNEVGKMGRAISKYMLSGISNIASLNFNKITGRTERIEWSNDEKDKYVLYLVGQERKIAFEQLSGGEQVSVAIAIRGTMTEYFTNSRFMILDEPTNNLDTERKKLLAEYMGEILKNLDQSIIVTHDDTFREMAEKIIEL